MRKFAQRFSRRGRTHETTHPRNSSQYPHLLGKDGRLTIERIGPKQFPWQDLYHLILSMSWPSFLTLTMGLYVATNFVFAVAYRLEKDSVSQSKSLIDAFFFSIQTMATIGYGVMSPLTVYANVLVAIESLVGLLGIAMITGVMFARFARPTARVLFSQVAIISPHDGVPMFMFRAANQRSNQILDARLWVTLTRDEQTVEGHYIRRIRDLMLIRNHTPFFELTWTAMHPIDEDSPLYGETIESLTDDRAEIFVTLTGTDGTFAQTVYARHSYIASEMEWNKRFVDIFCKKPNGKRVIDYTHFHKVIPLLSQPPESSLPPL